MPLGRSTRDFRRPPPPGVMDANPKRPENPPHQYNYNSPPNPKQHSVIAAKDCSEKGEGAVPEPPTQVRPKRPEKGMVRGIRPDELPRLTPKLKPYLRRPDPTWPDIIDREQTLSRRGAVSRIGGPVAMEPKVRFRFLHCVASFSLPAGRYRGSLLCSEQRDS